MILGDSLQVMASLAEREGLRGKVQCIYFDPPYGIKFNSNFQWSTTSRDVKDGKADHITREPEQVKAFRDTWRDGIHCYLTYLRDRLTVARDLLTESGSIFVQIGDENVHRVRAVMDEVFGEENFVALDRFRRTTGELSESACSTVMRLHPLVCEEREHVQSIGSSIFQRDSMATTERQIYAAFELTRWYETARYSRLNETAQIDSATVTQSFALDNLTSQAGGRRARFDVAVRGQDLHAPATVGWKTTDEGMNRLAKADRSDRLGQDASLSCAIIDDFPCYPIDNIWDDTRHSGFSDRKVYVVQTVDRSR